MKTKIICLLLTLIGVQLTLSAQTDKRIDIEFKNEMLPTALKRIEAAADCRILFTYSDVQDYRVTASLSRASVVQAVEKVLEGKPLAYTRKGEQYIIIFAKDKASRKATAIRGKVIDENHHPMPYCNVLLLTTDSAFVNGCVTEGDGSFVMKGEEGTPYLLKTSYIGYATAVQPVAEHNLVRMTPDTHALQEVTVTAERPLIEPITNGLKANVAGTSLAKMGSAAEMLAHLPFVTGSDGNYSVLGHGTPIIYINSRKVRDTSELDRLCADEIVSAEVITTPGAEYASDVASVIRIRTIKQRGQGWSGRTSGKWTQGHMGRGNAQVSLNYRTGGLDIFGSGNVTQSSLYGNSWIDDRLEASSVWESYTTKHYHQKSNRFSGMLGFNYEFNEKHSFGMRYEAGAPFGNHKKYVYADVSVKRDGELYEEMETEQVNQNKSRWKHSLNGYYTGSLGKWQMDVNADYLFGQSESMQEVTNNGEAAAQSTSKIRNYLYAVKAVASTSLPLGHLSVGTEETFTNRHDLFLQSGFSADNDSHVRQSLWSAFADYSVTIGKWRLSGGIRYEHQATEYHENGIHKPEQSPTYNDFTPSLSANYSDGDWNASLSYKILKFNPPYGLLTNTVSYQSKYEYATGNPLLKKAKTQTLLMNLSWKWIYLTASYLSSQNQYLQMRQAYNDETHPGVTLFHFVNIPQTYTMQSSIVLSPEFGIWRPQFTFHINYWDADLTSFGIRQNWKGPYTYYILDNNFNLPKGWFVNLQGTYVPKFKQGPVKKEPISTIDLRLRKSFLKDDALTATLTIDDIFHQQHNTMTSYFIGTSTTSNEYYDHQRIGIQLAYKFNATKSKYKGTGAGQSEKNRL